MVQPPGNFQKQSQMARCLKVCEKKYNCDFRIVVSLDRLTKENLNQYNYDTENLKLQNHMKRDFYGKMFNHTVSKSNRTFWSCMGRTTLSGALRS